jgi:hypothetical protein
MGPGGLGLATTVQLVPFHRMVSVRRPFEARKLPTAKQFVVLVHDTPSRSLPDAPGGLGLATSVQVVPFHRSINAPPTAKQFVALVHETPRRRVSVLPAGVGLATIVHALPFHRSTNARITFALTEKPTAKQLDGLVHDTSSRTAADAPGGVGLGTAVQLVPFQRRTPVLLPDWPTAKQLVVLLHDTAERLRKGVL